MIIMIKDLQKLGLTRNESKVYTILLSLGSTTAGLIIKKTHLHRNIVYDNLEKLIHKGLVSFIITKGKKHFSTTKPEELVKYIENQKKKVKEKEDVLYNVLPGIIKRRKEFLKPAEASIVKGKKGLKVVFDSVADATHELMIFSSGWGMKHYMKHYFDQWHVKLAESKVKVRSVLNQKLMKHQKYQYNERYLPQEMVMPTTIMIHGEKVINVIWQDDPILIIINSKKVAEAYTAYFKLLWKLGKNERIRKNW